MMIRVAYGKSIRGIFWNCIGATGIVIAAICGAFGASSQQPHDSVRPSRTVPAGALAIQITSDNSFVVRTGRVGQPSATRQYSRDDGAGVRQRIREASMAGTLPLAAIRLDDGATFQSLASVIDALVAAKIARFEVATESTRVTVTIPKGSPVPGQSDINLMFTAEGTYGIGNSGKFEHLDPPGLARLLSKQVTGKKCCYVFIHGDEGAPGSAYINAVAAIQLAAIDDYWIVVKSAHRDERDVQKERMKKLEKERERLLKVRANQTQ